MRAVLRLLTLMVISALALQVYFAARIACMRWIDPASTTFERSRAWQLATGDKPAPRWQQQWVDYGQISDSLKRAVLASEDDAFVSHSGVDWKAMQLAWRRNQRTAERNGHAAGREPDAAPRMRGGSTITQQLAKNLFLSPEQTYLRKAQELALTFMLESLLDKRRILEIYLNHVEWGEGIFGAEAAAQHYFGKPASTLDAQQAARLAVMLPAPRRFEKAPHSPWLKTRARTIAARMRNTTLP